MQLKQQVGRRHQAFQGSRGVVRRPTSIVCQASGNEQQSRRQVIGTLVNLGASLVAAPAMADAFLSSTGARGLLAEEEQRLYQLRVEKETAAREELARERSLLEQEAKRTQDGKLCATPFGVDVVGITELIALIGALVGGVTARRRKEEVERLNEQLRSINLNLRQQARAGTVYAPGLSYAPPAAGGAVAAPSRNGTAAAPLVVPAAAAVATLPPPAAVVPKPEPVAASIPSASPASAALNTLFSMEEEEMSSDQIQCKEALRAGKRLLKEKNGAAAMVRFEKALMLSKALADKVQERRAQRGLAASCRITHQYRQAIKHLERVLEISREIGEYTGDADAFGTMADCYTDMGEFEKAAVYYDKYIERMNKDGPI
ncbi:hypothetical protein CHLRE_10g460050v5 [Chlamydomonas reinhardtii]|uniref:Chloroplast Flu-like protein short form n=1 Tax=Chlamydomonas reinhardtii TaxID=3055 RepID=Q64FN7_CHLRE|nr:uncharacterized protein CHLRE_10g460050v5 [Chlamydomonas reinhardtii]AAU14894.1 chloroplast Flu-like protein short form [Chlamydomonas reinhardtii]PNW77995.1 hypothetical protein CHLRE_10g460050v5 [Chlamydomonas reinhardtii]|eukprot:XP_001698401.1 FLU chloroplast precursor, alternative spliced version s-FLP [Chlamydomonas reinhardtii]